METLQPLTKFEIRRELNKVTPQIQNLNHLLTDFHSMQVEGLTRTEIEKEIIDLKSQRDELLRLL